MPLGEPEEVPGWGPDQVIVVLDKKVGEPEAASAITCDCPAQIE